MYDTYITIVGNVLNPPEWRRTTNTGALVTTFKIASTARRIDRDSGKWVDGNSLRVRVSCWRALASNVFQSVTVGDPLIVTGRLSTRDWTDEAGNKRLSYELEATAVGHDLTRGRNRFERVKQNTSTSAVEDPHSAMRVGGEPTVPVAAEHAPAQFDSRPYQPSAPDELAPFGDGMNVPDPPDAAGSDPGPVADLADLADPDDLAGSDPTDPADPLVAEPAVADATVADATGSEPAVAEPAQEPGLPEEPEPGRRRGLRRTKVPA